MQGNFIGLSPSGAAMANAGNGITVMFGATKNTIGGVAAGARNVISGNFSAGVAITNVGTTGNFVQGNFIGTDATGNVSMPNFSGGVRIDDAANNTIGGISAAARNVISANIGGGVTIQNAGATGNLVQGNYIGTNAAGASALRNSPQGVHIWIGASNNTIGGVVAGAGNVISGISMALSFRTLNKGNQTRVPHWPGANGVSPRKQRPWRYYSEFCHQQSYWRCCRVSNRIAHNFGDGVSSAASVPSTSPARGTGSRIPSSVTSAKALISEAMTASVTT